MKVMDKRCVFNVYSKTNLSNWEMKGGANLRLIDFALPVDTSFYCSDCLPRRTKRFIYFDNRSEVDLQQIVQGLRSKGLEFEIVSEDISDADYLSLLQSSKYGIWIGGHTMEGFKYREALSCNVPLVVWNIIHLDEQVKYTEDGGLYASSIPWWDARCGLTAYDAQTILLNIQKMEETWESYTPRQYILETASPSACGREWFQGLY
jgi:hypothetical protein